MQQKLFTLLYPHEDGSTALLETNWQSSAPRRLVLFSYHWSESSLRLLQKNFLPQKFPHIMWYVGYDVTWCNTALCGPLCQFLNEWSCCIMPVRIVSEGYTWVLFHVMGHMCFCSEALGVVNSSFVLLMIWPQGLNVQQCHWWSPGVHLTIILTAPRTEHAHLFRLTSFSLYFHCTSHCPFPYLLW